MRHRSKIASVLVGALLAGSLIAVTAQPAAAAFGQVTAFYIVPTKFGKIYLEVEHPTKNGKIVKAPVILTYSPYSVLGRNGDAGEWVPQGYARAYADVVGTGNSGGCYDYGGTREKVTGKQIVDYIGKAKWSTGKVGMMGGSYDGTTATATAVMKPKALKTIIPMAAISRWYGYAYAGGIRYTYTNEFAGNTGPGAATDEGFDTPLAFDFGLAVPPPLDVTGDDWAGRVQSTMTPCEEIEHTQRGYSDTPDYDKFWKERDYLAGARKLKIPVLVAHNWGDWNVKQDEAWNLWNALKGRNKKLYMGTRWDGHGSPGGKFDEVVHQWMDHYLMGKKNNVEDLAKITSQTSDYDGPGKFISGAPKVKPMKLIAQAEVTTDPDDTNVWQLYPHKPDLKVYQGGAEPPTAQFPVTGANIESHAGHHGRSNHEWWWFESAVLQKDMRVFGEIKVKMYSKIDREWITFTLSIYDVDPSVHQQAPGIGQHYTTDPNAVVAVTRGFLDSRYRDGLNKQKALKNPMKGFELSTGAHPVDYTFKKGHYIGLNLQTEIIEWMKSKPYTGLISPDSTHIKIEWTGGKTGITLPVVGGGSPESYFGGTHH